MELQGSTAEVTGLEMVLLLDVGSLRMQLGVAGHLAAMHLFGVLECCGLRRQLGVVVLAVFSALLAIESCAIDGLETGLGTLHMRRYMCCPVLWYCLPWHLIT